MSNNTLSFYTLPELSPAAFGRPLTCGWVGGVDLDADPENGQNDVVIMLCLKNRIRPVRVGSSPMKLKDIEFAGCQSVVRRGDFACVADSRSYALLDVTHQQKVPLFTISSLDNESAETSGNIRDDLSVGSGTISRAMSPSNDPIRKTMEHERGHRKSSSLAVFRRDVDGEYAMPGSSSGGHGFDSPSRIPGSRRVSTTDISPDSVARPELGKPLPLTPGADSRPGSTPSARPIVALKPLVASPNQQLFLLVTGTAPHEPSLGMFVNLDGEVDRGTIEFPNYPEMIVVDGKGQDMSASVAEDLGEDGYVLAVVQRALGNKSKRGVQIQRWDLEASENMQSREWLNISALNSGTDESVDTAIGLKSMAARTTYTIKEVAQRLALTPIQLNPKGEALFDSSRREKEEFDLFQKLCQVPAHLCLWRGADVYWLLRNPTVLKLDSRLKLAQAMSIEPDSPIAPQREMIQALLDDIRSLRTTNELDFYSLNYIRQKAALLLFMDLVLQTLAGSYVAEYEKRYTEQALIESELDPRIVVSFLPTVQQEVTQAKDGIWVQGGLRHLITVFDGHYDLKDMATELTGPYGSNLLEVVVRFLLYWRRKKGNPSVVDGKHVFETVDASVLLILLQLDSLQPPGVATQGSLRAELYAIVDNGVDCSDRAIELLEQFKRLYVLSRHYQRRKSLSLVLSTWKRILNGEEDRGGELVDGELELRKYLSKLRDRNLVIDYATWLAKRNPKLGVQVFADENARVTIPPNEALLILRGKAPNAVKDFLEYLVFGKKQSQHINELIAYYLDLVLDELKTSATSKRLLLDTYETYRALLPPKPTYRQFITDNAIDAEWWHSRLRLLHLLGGNHGPSASYDLEQILDKLGPYVNELVPEMIILNGRQGRHKEALSLLTHGLGDFDTAISYCLLGGASIFRPPTGYVPEDSLPTQEHQAKLFNFLLLEFLSIEDIDSRIERTGELLERFGPWFDPGYVLGLLPDDWALNIFSTFLINSLQRLVRDQRESLMIKALSMAQNLRVSEQLIDREADIGVVIEKEHGTG